MTSDEWVTLPVTLAELDAIIDRTRAEERALAVEVQEKAVKDAEERGHLQARLEGMLLGHRSVLDRLNNPDEALLDAVLVAVGRYDVQGTPDHDGYGPPFKLEGPWCLVDTSRAEPEVNWPGELVGEFARWEDANREKWCLVTRALAAALEASPTRTETAND